MPFFSIIVPTYNRAHTLGRCIDSIIGQTFIDWELVIIDDGSTDGTESLVKTYEDERIRYVWQENQERSAARNHGLSLAIGEWICCQDSDDEYLPEHLAVLKDGIQSFPSIAAIRSGVIIHDADRSITKSNTQAPDAIDIFPWECMTSSAFKNSILENLRFDERFNSSEDLHFLLQVSQLSDIKVLSSHTVNAYIDSSRLTNMEARKSSIASLDDILRWYKGEKLTYIKRMRCHHALGLLKNGRSVWQGIKECGISFAYYPIDFLLVLKSKFLH
jgi:glycosyltransferase involved in cell wall biosynthesis